MSCAVRFQVVSVAHTGTRFLEDLLGVKSNPLCSTIIPQIDWAIPAVLPMREPKEVMRSYKRRESDYTRMLEQFYNLFCLIESPADLLVIPLDNELRQHRLDVLNHASGSAFTTDWAKQETKDFQHIGGKHNVPSHLERWDLQDETIHHMLWTLGKTFFESNGYRSQ